MTLATQAYRKLTDLVTLLRQEMTQQPELLAPLDFQISDQALVQAAAA
jgi:hypothetical protein